MLVLVFNCGSSSIKFALVDEANGQSLLTGLAERLGTDGANLEWKRGNDKGEQAITGGTDHRAAMQTIVEVLNHYPEITGNLGGIGHRVVHGGEQFTTSALVDESVIDAIRACNALAPLHNPVNLLGLEVAREVWTDLPHVAVFDTAFHQTMPKQAYLYGVPYAWYQEHGVRRYGFHGTSHRFVAAQAAEMLSKSPAECHLITAHLGNGCSLAAVRAGHSVDTTMGLTPLEGLMMGTRSGDIDPSIFEFISGITGWDVAKITKVLNKESGLLGISGVSNDMRTVTQAATDGNERAAIAIEVFCYRLAKAIGAMAVSLPRLDALVFTGGIGENAHHIREKTLAHLEVFGLTCDAERNTDTRLGKSGPIHAAGSGKVLVVTTNEELQIARETKALVAEGVAK
jgi:acetate kinase